MNFRKSLLKRLDRYVGRQLGKGRSPGSEYGFKKKKALFGEQEDLLILDVGANDGYTAQEYRRYFPKAQIYSFEPYPETFQKLNRAVGKDHLTTPVQLALSNWQGQAPLHIYPSSATNSLLRMETEGTLLQTVNVPVTTIDQFCQEHSITHIDILKTDAQGHDLSVLKGATDMLRAKRVGMLYVEVLFTPMYEGQDEFHEIVHTLFDAGYRLYDLFECAREQSGQLNYADALFVKG